MSEFSLPHHHGEGNVHSLRAELADTARFEAASALFKQLCDPTRLQIFWVLCHHEECVINIAALLGMSSPAVSHHLRSLHDSGLISSRRDGKEVYYKVADAPACDRIHHAAEEIMEIACPQTAVSCDSSHAEVIRLVHEYMLAHLSDRITIEELSRRFLLSPTTLKKVFKEVYGTSVAQHVKRHRMQRATELLRDTDMSIAGIAEAVGYESQSRFTAAFKEAYGVLPTAYRKAQRP